MGQEVHCRMQFNGQQHDGKALLETNEIIFRGEFRLKIPRTSITGVQAGDGRLSITFDQGTAVFELGKAAPKWAGKILHPPSRLDKLGIKSGMTLQVIGTADADFLHEIRQAGAVEAHDADLVFLHAPDKKALEKIRTLRKKTLWIIYPKGIQSITEGDVLTAGRAAGLVDIKVAAFSASHTALKFVPHGAQCASPRQSTTLVRRVKNPR